MFTIYGGKQEFMQWDLDQFVTNPCMQEGDEVVFYNSHGATYVVNAFAKDGAILADVPNYLLQMEGNILVDLEQGLDRHTECRTTFAVVAQAKPEGYDCQYNVPDRPVKNGGVSSWNDLTDKPFYEESGIVEILPELTAEVGEDSGVAMLPAAHIIVGNLYTVTYNGTAYECVANEADPLESGTMLPALGNMGGVDGGEPFFIMVDESAGEGILFPLDGATSVTLSIKGEGTTIHPLDAKFLPDGVPYVTEGMVEILPECQPTFFEEGGFALDHPLGLVSGESYLVTWNGTEYTCVAQEFPDNSLVALGNGSMLGGDDTGEPFALMEYSDSTAAETGFYVAIAPLDGTTELTISIYGKGETIRKLDSRCLPTDATVFHLTSPNGTKFAVTVADDGTLSAAKV